MSNKKATKRALLTSILAICLCLVMLIGSTFAWFTSTASTGVNMIQSGTLNVELYYQDTIDGKGESWTKVDANTKLNFLRKTENGVAQDADILWEPGATYYLPALKVVNEGNLALKYKIVINGATGDTKLMDVIDWTYGISGGGGADMATLETERHLTAKPDQGESADILTISGKMRETAGNDYQNKTISNITITVLATQDTVEFDSTTNQYDANATYADAVQVTDTTSAQDALDAATNGTVIQLAAGNYGTLYIRQSDKSVIDKGETSASSWTGTRTINNVTIIGTAGTVVDSIEVMAGTYDPNETGNIVSEANSLLSYFNINGLTIKNVTFSGQNTAMSFGNGRVDVNGLTFDGCKMTVTDDAENVRLLYINGEAKTEKYHNITVMNCEITGAHQVMDVRNVENLTVSNNVFKDIAARDIMISHSEGYTSGDVKITNNKSDGSANRFLRIANASQMNLVVTNNTITNFKYNGYFIEIDTAATNATFSGNSAACVEGYSLTGTGIKMGEGEITQNP